MATQIKRLALVYLVTLLEATYVSSTTSLNLRGFGGGRKLLHGSNGFTFASKVTAAQEGMDTRVDYGPPGSNPPYHEDPPSPLTMTSLDEVKNKETVFDIQIDYAPVNTHPSDYDYPPPSVASSQTVGSHSDSASLNPSPVPDYLDYPPLCMHPSRVTSSKTVGVHTDSAPLKPNSIPDYQDYPPPLCKSHGAACSVVQGCSPPS